MIPSRKDFKMSTEILKVSEKVFEGLLGNLLTFRKVNIMRIAKQKSQVSERPG